MVRAINSFDLTYAQYVTNPYRFGRNMTINQINEIKNISEKGSTAQQQKAIEMLNTVNFIRKARRMNLVG